LGCHHLTQAILNSGPTICPSYLSCTMCTFNHYLV